jgi:WD40 repeat protein
LNGHSSAVISLAVLQDGTLASSDNTIRLWDTKTGQSTKLF